MKIKLIAKLIFGMFVFCACSSNDSIDNPNIDITSYNIITNGNAAVTTITEEDNDYQPLKIVQTIPSFTNTTFSKSVSERQSSSEKKMQTRSEEIGFFPANLPIMFFFDDKIYLNSVEDNIIIKVDGERIYGTIVINEGANGYAILTFTPWAEFKVNSYIEVVVKADLQDKNGNNMLMDYNLIYEVSPKPEGEFSSNKGFENGTSGILFIGDGNIISETHGEISSQEGNKFAAISSGDMLVSQSGCAVGRATSTMILGPINSTIETLSFHYNFISAEFNEYVDSEFDDVAMITVYGPQGSYSEFITSVNKIRFDNENFTGFGMPDDGDSYAGHTGWKHHQIKLDKIGTPAYITFIITDVSDKIFSSIFAVDNLNY